MIIQRILQNQQLDLRKEEKMICPECGCGEDDN